MIDLFRTYSAAHPWLFFWLALFALLACKTVLVWPFKIA